MMKKLLVLALVLSMATLANAALTLTISGPTELAKAAVGTYTVTSSGQDLAGIDLDIISDQGAQPFGIGGGILLATSRNSALDTAAINGASGNYELVVVNDTPALIGTTLFSFTFTAGTTAGTYHVSTIENSIYDTDFNAVIGTVMPSFAVRVTPEPITMTLLGLGGLFLRRRSK
jgi:MYXO-CTERM domain-containing protein